MFHIQQISAYGTSTPAIARSTLQARDLLQACNIAEAAQEGILQHIFDMERHLIRCVEICDQVNAEAQRGLLGFKENRQASGKSIVVPAIPALTSKAESFLQAAKLALQLAGRIVGPVFLEKHGPKVGNFGFKFQELGKWCNKELGATNALTEMVLNAEPWVKQIVDMRNAVDHPRDAPKKRLIVKDFAFVLGGAAPCLVEPSWGLLGDPLLPIAASMEEIIEGVVSVQEDLVIGVFVNFRALPELTVVEIPEAERNPVNPRRFRVGLRGTDC